MSGNPNEIDSFTTRIIRRQFGILSAYIPLPNDGSVTVDDGNICYGESDCVAKQLGIQTIGALNHYNFESAAILLTAIHNRFHYIIHMGVGMAPVIDNPICFTVFNNTADRISNPHWEKTMRNFARKHRQGSCIVGYDDISLSEPLNRNGRGLLRGTIKHLQTDDLASRIAQGRATYTSRRIKDVDTYTELLQQYGAGINSKFGINSWSSEPYQFECAHNIQPTLHAHDIPAYYAQRKYFDRFYSCGYYSFAFSPAALEQARERLKQVIKQSKGGYL